MTVATVRAEAPNVGNWIAVAGCGCAVHRGAVGVAVWPSVTWTGRDWIRTSRRRYSALGSSGTSTACSRSMAMGTICRTASWVAARTTGAATPSP